MTNAGTRMRSGTSSGFVEALAAGDAHERGDVGLARLLEHEALERHDAALERDGRVDRAGHVRLHGFGVDLVDRPAPITNNVRNSDRPTSTWFGGVWPAPSACRRIASTITMRVNAVIISRMAGSSVSAVIRIRICSVSE